VIGASTCRYICAEHAHTGWVTVTCCVLCPMFVCLHCWGRFAICSLPHSLYSLWV
jgi:hypothetical protein